MNRLTVKCDSYREGFVRLMFIRQQFESSYGKSVNVTERV